MAYISAEQVAEKRAAIKAAFPLKDGWKFSITGDRNSLNIAITQSPFELQCHPKIEGSDFWRDTNKVVAIGEHATVNHHCLRTNDHNPTYPEQTLAVFKKITAIAMAGNHDNSDAMTDYFDVGWYFHLSVGKWDKPCVVKK